MTPILLQRELRAELERLFADFHSSEGMQYGDKPVAVYLQDVPFFIEDEEDCSKPPYILVRLSEGEMEDWRDAEQVKVLLIFCSESLERERTGFADVANMIQCVKERLLKNPQVGAYFTAELPLKWVIQEGDTYGLYYGGMEIIFACPVILRESAFA